MMLRYTATVFPCKQNYAAAAVPAQFMLREMMPMGYSETIALLRKRLGLTQGELAEKLSVEQPTVQRWESGKREPTISKLTEIAQVLGVAVSDLLDEGFVPLGPRLYVKGEVAAGVWRDAYEWPQDEWQTFTGRADVTADIQHRFGLRISGDSMNEVYPTGTVVECVSVFGRTEAVPGKRVVVVRTDTEGKFEATVKELAQDGDGRMWAVPRSTNPTFRAINLSEPEPGILETRIAAVVVASYRPE